MKLTSAIAGGLAGAAILTLIHESVRRISKDAPRMDLLGMEALEKSLDKVNVPVPDSDNLFKVTMASDIISNSAYYGLVAIGSEKKALIRGSILGLAAGFGAVYLPKPLGLSEAPSNRTPQTKLMSVAWYLIGGLAASATSKLMEKHW